MRDFDEISSLVYKLYTARDYRKGLEVSMEAERLFPRMRGQTIYWIACFHSLLGNSGEALRTLQDAIEMGYFWHKDTLLQEPDLKPLHGDSQFNMIVRRSEKLRMEAMHHVKPRLEVFLPRAASQGAKFPTMVTLHGRSGNALEHSKRWRSLTVSGIICAVPQSGQVFQKGMYCWDDAETAEKEVDEAFRKLIDSYPTEAAQMMTGGFSQGGAVAVRMALERRPVKIKGFVAVSPAFREIDSLVQMIRRGVRVGLKGYLFTGENDPSRTRIEELHHKMVGEGLPCKLAVEPGVGHDYPRNFRLRLASATKFVLSPT